MNEENKYLDKYDKALMELGYDDLVEPEKFKNEYLRLLEENGISYQNVQVDGKNHDLMDFIIKSAWEQDIDNLLLEMPGFPSFEDMDSGNFVFPITESHAKLMEEYVEKHPEKSHLLSLIQDQLKIEKKEIYTEDIRSRMRNRIKSESLGMVHIPTVRKELEKAMRGQQQGNKIFVSNQSMVLKAGKNVIELVAFHDPFYDHSERPDPQFNIFLNGEHIWGLKYELTDDFYEEEDVNSRYRLVEGKLNSLKLTELIQHLKNIIGESEIVIICKNEDIVRKINDENLRFKDLYGYTGQDENVDESKLCKDSLQKADIRFRGEEIYLSPNVNEGTIERTIMASVSSTHKLVDRLALLNGFQKEDLKEATFVCTAELIDGLTTEAKSIELLGNYFLKTDKKSIFPHHTYLYLSKDEKEMLYSKIEERYISLPDKEIKGESVTHDMAVQNSTGIKDRMAHAKKNLQKRRNERPHNRNEKEMTR